MLISDITLLIDITSLFAITIIDVFFWSNRYCEQSHVGEQEEATTFVKPKLFFFRNPQACSTLIRSTLYTSLLLLPSSDSGDSKKPCGLRRFLSAPCFVFCFRCELCGLSVRSGVSRCVACYRDNGIKADMYSPCKSCMAGMGLTPVEQPRPPPPPGFT